MLSYTDDGNNIAEICNRIWRRDEVFNKNKCLVATVHLEYRMSRFFKINFSFLPCSVAGARSITITMKTCYVFIYAFYLSLYFFIELNFVQFV